jgi:hypothetical protein
MIRNYLRAVGIVLALLLVIGELQRQETIETNNFLENAK